MDQSSTDQEPEQITLFDASTERPIEGLEVPPHKPKKSPSICYKFALNLGSLGPRLRAHAERQRISMSALMRRATLRMLDEEQAPRGASIAPPPFEHSARNVHFHLLLPPAYAAELTARARAAVMTRGEFVWSLLKGISPPALPPDHAVAVQALRASTDRIAAMSTDLSAFLRLITKAAATKAELEPYRANLRSLDTAVRDHLKVASVLIDELRPNRRVRW